MNDLSHTGSSGTEVVRIIIHLVQRDHTSKCKCTGRAEMQIEVINHDLDVAEI